MRETYRLNKTELIDKSINSRISLTILFSLSKSAYEIFEQLNFKELQKDMKFLLARIENKIEIS